jgi:hypothetical protein
VFARMYGCRDLLPEEQMERDTKASYTHTYIPPTRVPRVVWIDSNPVTDGVHEVGSLRYRQGKR